MGLFIESILRNAIRSRNLKNSISTEILRGFEPGSIDDRSALFVNADGFIGIKFFCFLIPPQFAAIERISFQNIFYYHTVF